MPIASLLRLFRPTAASAAPTTPAAATVLPFDAPYVAEPWEQPDLLAHAVAAHAAMVARQQQDLRLALLLGAPVQWQAQQFHWYAASEPCTSSTVGHPGALLDVVARCRRMNTRDRYRAYPAVPAYTSDHATIADVFAAFRVGGRFTDRAHAFTRTLATRLEAVPSTRADALPPASGPALVLRAVDQFENLPAVVAAAALAALADLPTPGHP